jgi:hypothetical protein
MAGHSTWKTTRAKRLAGEQVDSDYAAMVEEASLAGRRYEQARSL